MFYVKTVHIICAAISFSGFFLRGLLMITGSDYLQKRWVKITPHLVDTLLLGSALVLVAGQGLSPLQHSWLLAKLVFLLVYIGLGLVALRFGKTRSIRILAWSLALLVFIHIVFIARSKSVAGILVFIQ